MKKIATTTTAAALVAIMSASTAFAAHNNPWAGPDDVVQGKKHDAKQAKSIGRPGEDEMRGAMERDGFGKTGGAGRGSGGGNVGKGGGNAGKGGGNAGKGGGNAGKGGGKHGR